MAEIQLGAYQVHVAPHVLMQMSKIANSEHLWLFYLIKRQKPCILILSFEIVQNSDIYSGSFIKVKTSKIIYAIILSFFNKPPNFSPIAIDAIK